MSYKKQLIQAKSRLRGLQYRYDREQESHAETRNDYVAVRIMLRDMGVDVNDILKDFDKKYGKSYEGRKRKQK